MESFHIARFFVLVLAVVILSVHAKPTLPKSEGGENSSAKNDVATTTVKDVTDNDDGELLETANAIVFRPLFAYRRMQSSRRRVYVPRRRYPGYYYYG
ncbi:hypothetical protein Zmor_021035 [Zophobas morio]|uniref:Uncharacterized protein n=1 Tax=Zophobas morio TaxID=2755281 RepID=A0AA38MAB5_9CUCU|nr:hypothetical protein Zmor_021035 [Zophobas morio]